MSHTQTQRGYVSERKRGFTNDKVHGRRRERRMLNREIYSEEFPVVLPIVREKRWEEDFFYIREIRKYEFQIWVRRFGTHTGGAKDTPVKGERIFTNKADALDRMAVLVGIYLAQNFSK